MKDGKKEKEKNIGKMIRKGKIQGRKFKGVWTK
jgi:hypothetical protein